MVLDKDLQVFFFFFSRNFFENFGFAHLFLCNEENPKKVLAKKHKKVTVTIMLCFPKKHFSCCDQQLFFGNPLFGTLSFLVKNYVT